MDWLPLAAGGNVSADVAILSTAGIVALLTLTLMEIVLGIDNVVFVAILAGKLPKDQQAKARYIGMGLALGLRVGLLFCISWIMSLTAEILPIPESIRPGNWAEAKKTGLSWRDLILLGGGLFLIYKSATEIWHKLEGDDGHGEGGSGATFGSVLFQIIILDIVFSLDSVITAVGMVSNVTIMIIAMLVAVTVMIAAAGSIGGFVEKHPSVKILALSFLNLIGVMLVAESFGQHVNKGYIYSAMAFSLVVELLNMRFRKKRTAVQLHEPTVQEAGLEK